MDVKPLTADCQEIAPSRTSPVTAGATPSTSQLLLHDHNTDPLTVTSLAPIQLDHAWLAYLSACCTACNSSVEPIDELYRRLRHLRFVLDTDASSRSDTGLSTSSDSLRCGSACTE